MAPPRLQHGVAGVPRRPWGHQGLRTGPLMQSEPRKPEKPQAKPDNLISLPSKARLPRRGGGPTLSKDVGGN